MQIVHVNTVDVAAYDRASGESRWAGRFANVGWPRLAVAGERIFVT